MASATLLTETIDTGVTLDLDADEARTLVDILRAVGGSPDTSRRGYSRNVLQALTRAGVTPSPKRSAQNSAADLTGNLTFTDLD